MRKLLPIALLVGTLALGGCAAPSTITDTTDNASEATASASLDLPNTFTENGMSFDYPSGWTKTRGSNDYTFVLTSPAGIPFATVNAGVPIADTPFPNPFRSDDLDSWASDMTAMFDASGGTVSDPIVNDDGHLITYVTGAVVPNDDGGYYSSMLYFGFTADYVYSLSAVMDPGAGDEQLVATMLATVQID